MGKLSILDCTLRDGGYVNNWRFGKKNIPQIARRLCEASLDYVECGFLSETKEHTDEQSVFSTVADADKTFCDCSHSVALMINCGEYSPDHIPQYNGGKTSILRIAFHKHQIEEAQMLSISLKEKGYTVFFQPMVTTGYSDRELLSLIEWANENNPEAVYIVDSFGTMRKSDVLRMFYLIDNNLAPSIKIGFHSHNNLQLSFSNAQELIRMNSKRDIIIDSSVLGMGRGAGNLCTELLTQYINENIENKYDLIPILEIMDEYILPVYSHKPWGYSASYYIAAVNECHPNYATYLMDKQTLCIRDIHVIIKRIPVAKKQLYNESLIADLYSRYQQHNVDDHLVLERLQQLCRDRNILILAPGRSLITYETTIKNYIRTNNPIVFSINHIPDRFPYDIVFISNLKRFKCIDDAVEKLGDSLICTSNLMKETNVHVVNYASYLNDDDIISDNAGLMLINVLRKVGVNRFALAGYDGYFDGKMNLNVRYQQREVMNRAITSYFAKLCRVVEVKFVTPSLYEENR